jgi:hypothetical protein
MHLQRELVDPAALGTEDRQDLAQALHALNAQIFSGVSRAEFDRTVISPPSAWTRIQLLRNEAGTCVGYEALHRYHFLLRDREQVVFRAQAGILKPYRGQGRSFPFGLRQALRYKLCHPAAHLVLFATIVHPSSFHLLAKHCHELYPHPFHPTPPRIRTLMHDLAAAFDERRPPVGDDPEIRQEDWITRDDEDDTAFWQHSRHPDVRYFLRVNPGYRQGHALLTLVPVSWKNLLWSLLPALLRHCRCPGAWARSLRTRSKGDKAD